MFFLHFPPFQPPSLREDATSNASSSFHLRRRPPFGRLDVSSKADLLGNEVGPFTSNSLRAPSESADGLSSVHFSMMSRLTCYLCDREWDVGRWLEVGSGVICMRQGKQVVMTDVGWEGLVTPRPFLVILRSPWLACVTTATRGACPGTT